MTPMPVDISLPEDLVIRLAGMVAAESQATGTPVSMQAMLERAIGTEADWAKVVASGRLRTMQAQPQTVRVRCDCCEPHFCRNVMQWRGKPRCACTPERLKAA